MKIRERVLKFRRLSAVILTTALIYLLYIVFYDSIVESWGLGRLKFPRKNYWDDISDRLNSTSKKILFWNTMFGDETFYFGKGDLFRHCPDVGQNCWATHDRSYFKAEDFDAILFHGNELNFLNIPSKRRPSQNYVFVNLESPENRPMTYWSFENHFFNSTMTYRLDSDIKWTYANVRRLDDGYIVAPRLDAVWDIGIPESTDIGATNSSEVKKIWDESATMKIRNTKSKTAIWFVSNCRSQSGREKYVKELSTFVDVDIFGACGKQIGCPVNRNCFSEVVEPNYYFYLSFENSMCQDYVTEKLYNALKHNVVPIVYGGANYSLFAPPSSYINALDFDSPKELAIYLKKLISQPKEYEKYFEWKKRYEIVNSNRRAICQLCQYLHENNATKSYSPISAWYQSDKCPLQEKLKTLSYLTKKDLANGR